MSQAQISADDVAQWDSLGDIAASLEKRGLKQRPDIERDGGYDDELLLEIEEDRYIALINAGSGDDPTNYNSRQTRTVPTNFVATRDFETFSFIMRERSLDADAHGRITRKQFSFDKSQIIDPEGERYSVLDKLNEIEYGDGRSLTALFDTRQVVDEFYEDFEEIRTDLVAEVDGIPDDHGDAKRRFVQVTLNRLIFLHFIQEKGLLGTNDTYLIDQHQKFAADGDVHEDFYQPLFFEALAQKSNRVDFDKVPYLNGGLFSKTPIEQQFPEARLGDDAEESAELYGEILEFLSSWNWHVDERLDVVEPKNLSPAVLGHIFEQTVNQKEMGAYYTPEEITSFMVRESIHPRILDAVNEQTGADYDEIDKIFGLDAADVQEGGDGAMAADGGAITQQATPDAATTDHVETLYFDVLKDLHILDPAVGSGAFLLAAEDVLLDVYLHAIEYFQRLYDEQPLEVSGRIRDELDAIENAGSKSLYAKREIILNNLYGVDIDDGAVEICKLRLWLSMVADIEDNDPGAVDPLPNIDFNIRQGNSLIGFTELVEVNDDGDAKLTNYGGGIGDSVRDKYEDVIEATEKHRAARTKEGTEKWRVEAERRREKHAEALDQKVLQEFYAAGIDEVSEERLDRYSPFHWVIEFPTVYRDGGFNVIIGNPPWDVIKPDRDDFFPKYDEKFRTRLPDDKDSKQEELLEDPDIAAEWEEFQREMEVRADYYNEASEYELQSPKVDGRTVANENDLSLLFFERATQLARDSSYVSLIMPGNFYLGASAKDLRDYVVDNTSLHHLVQFNNKNIFPDLESKFYFAICTFKNSGSSEMIKGKFSVGDLSPLERFDQVALNVPVEVLRRYSPESRIFPFLRSQEQVDALSNIVQHPSIGEDIDGKWFAEPYRELDRAQDSDRYVESARAGDYPVYGGRNIYQFIYDDTFLDVESPELWSVAEDESLERSAKRRIREKQFYGHSERFNPKKAIYTTFNGTGSQKSFVNDLLQEHRDQPLTEEDVLLDCTEYRLGYREIAPAQNERSLIAAVIPKGTVCHHKIHTIRPYTIEPEESDLCNYPIHSAYERIFTDRELFVAVGLFNSLPFDYLMRSKVDSSIVMYKFKESQVPRLSAGDDWFDYIWRRAAQLNCYGEAFEEMRERLGGIDPITDPEARRETQAEIDAAAFHAYGIEESEVEFILDDFHQVRDPRMMDDDYFEMVLEKYRDLL